MTMRVYQLGELGKRAIELLEEAIGQIRDGADAIPTVCQAEAVLRVEVGELRPEAIPPDLA
jgi:hypothetical protein